MLTLAAVAQRKEKKELGFRNMDKDWLTIVEMAYAEWLINSHFNLVLPQQCLGQNWGE